MLLNESILLRRFTTGELFKLLILPLLLLCVRDASRGGNKTLKEFLRSVLWLGLTPGKSELMEPRLDSRGDPLIGDELLYAPEDALDKGGLCMTVMSSTTVTSLNPGGTNF